MVPAGAEAAAACRVSSKTTHSLGSRRKEDYVSCTVFGRRSSKKEFAKKPVSQHLALAAALMETEGPKETCCGRNTPSRPPPGASTTRSSLQVDRKLHHCPCKPRREARPASPWQHRGFRAAVLLAIACAQLHKQLWPSHACRDSNFLAAPLGCSDARAYLVAPQAS